MKDILVRASSSRDVRHICTYNHKKSNGNVIHHPFTNWQICNNEYVPK